MIVVKIELHSALTGAKTVLGQMRIINDGTTKNAKRGHYNVDVMRKGKSALSSSSEVARTGRVENYPRLSYNVWRLISRALISAFPEEQNKRDKELEELRELAKRADAFYHHVTTNRPRSKFIGSAQPLHSQLQKCKTIRGK